MTTATTTEILDYTTWRSEVRSLAIIAGLGDRWLSSLAIFDYTDGVTMMQPQDFDFGKGDGGNRRITKELADKIEAQFAVLREAHPKHSTGAFYRMKSEKEWGSRKAKAFRF